MSKTPAPRMLSEGLRLARLCMVLSSFSPLFVLWAIRGTCLIPDWAFITGCALVVLVPNGVLFGRLWVAQRQQDRREIVVGESEDHRDHVLVYLFALVLPFYSEEIGEWRAFAATVAAIAIILFLFWHLNLHYMNIVFAVLKMQVFSVSPPEGATPLSGRDRFVLITWRRRLTPGARIVAHRISNSVYWERRP